MQHVKSNLPKKAIKSRIAKKRTYVRSIAELFDFNMYRN